jgi:hypothetical protein
MVEGEEDELVEKKGLVRTLPQNEHAEKNGYAS